MHQRRVIRNQIVASLLNNTGAADRVYPNRARNLFDTPLPAITVFTLNETSTEFKDEPREIERIVRVAIQITAEANDQLDDVLDDTAKEVEDIIHGDTSINKTATDALLSETEMVINTEGNKLLGAVRLTFDVTYETSVET